MWCGGHPCAGTAEPGGWCKPLCPNDLRHRRKLLCPMGLRRRLQSPADRVSCCAATTYTVVREYARRLHVIPRVLGRRRKSLRYIGLHVRKSAFLAVCILFSV